MCVINTVCNTRHYRVFSFLGESMNLYELQAVSGDVEEELPNFRYECQTFQLWKQLWVWRLTRDLRKWDLIERLHTQPSLSCCYGLLFYLNKSSFIFHTISETTVIVKISEERKCAGLMSLRQTFCHCVTLGEFRSSPLVFLPWSTEGTFW